MYKHILQHNLYLVKFTQLQAWKLGMNDIGNHIISIDKFDYFDEFNNSLKEPSLVIMEFWQ